MSTIREKYADVTKTVIMDKMLEMYPKLFNNLLFLCYYTEYMANLNDPKINPKYSVGAIKNEPHSLLEVSYDYTLTMLARKNALSGTNQLTGQRIISVMDNDAFPFRGIGFGFMVKDQDKGSKYSIFQHFNKNSDGNLAIAQNINYEDGKNNWRHLDFRVNFSGEEQLSGVSGQMCSNVKAENGGWVAKQYINFWHDGKIEPNAEILLREPNDCPSGLFAKLYTPGDGLGVNLMSLTRDHEIGNDIDLGAAINKEEFYEYFCQLFSGQIDIFKRENGHLEKVYTKGEY